MSQLYPPPLHTLLLDLEHSTGDPGEHLLCRFCHAPITRTGDAIGEGEQRYRVINPHGAQFELACFRTAPGCDIRGRATLEATWFKGFSWQLAQCSDCHEHLGWYYEHGARDSFFGLIVSKLISNPKG